MTMPEEQEAIRDILNLTQEAQHMESQLFTALHVAPPPPTPKRIRELSVGPVDVRVDMAQLQKLVDGLARFYSRFVAMVAGPELMKLMVELTEGKREPKDDMERSILRALKGPTRFDLIEDQIKGLR